MSIIKYSYKRDKNLRLNEYFMLNEFVAGNLKNQYESGKYDEILLDSVIVDILYLIRKKRNCPLYVNSGFRPIAYNASIKGSTNSYHCKGMAADVYMKDVSPIELAYTTKELGACGIGVYVYSNNKNDGFVHIDSRPSNYYWLQIDKNGSYKSINKIMPNIKQGDSGYAVKLIQRKLGITVDGSFGPITRRNLIDKYGHPCMTDKMWVEMFK